MITITLLGLYLGIAILVFLACFGLNLAGAMTGRDMLRYSLLWFYYLLKFLMK